MKRKILIIIIAAVFAAGFFMVAIFSAISGSMTTLLSSDNDKESELEYADENDIVIEGSGVLSWPCKGTVTSEQGWRIHPIYGYRKYHAGMDIGVATGTPIRAAADGTVTLASWYGGYGNCVMINHGDGLVTLYGHNSALCVSKGDKVKRGQIIAKAGSTGASTGPHCHFEVRVNGEVKNPRNYL